MSNSRFSIRDLFWAVSFTAAACGVGALTHRTDIQPPLVAIAYLAAATLAGDGVGSLYQRKAAGAAIGFGVMFAFGIGLEILLGFMAQNARE